MLHALDVGVNANGVIVVTHERGMQRLPRGQTVQQWQEIQERRERERLVVQAEQGVQRRVAEVEQVLRQPQNRGLIASVNTETGEVAQTFMAPRPYFARHEDTAGDLPTPLDHETRSAFVTRCVGDPAIIAQYPQGAGATGQREAACDLIFTQARPAPVPGVPTNTAAARVAEVEHELRKPENRNVVASIDELGRGTAAVVPVPYYKLSAARRTELEQQAKALKIIVEDPRSNAVARTKARLELQHVQRLLDIDGHSGATKPPVDRSSGAPMR